MREILDELRMSQARIRLRPIALDDLDAVMGWINDPEVTRNFASLGHITREQEAAFLESMIASETDHLCAVETLDGEVIGTAGVHKIYWPARNGRVGLVIGKPAYHGNGYGQEALRALLRFGFEELGLHKLWAVHYSDNERMAHILRKHGFEQEGMLRDEYFSGGRFHDMVRLALLEDDFRAYQR